MAAVVNVLQFRESPDPALFERAAEELGPRMREVPGFQGLHVVRSGEAEIVLIPGWSSTSCRCSRCRRSDISAT